MHIVEIRHPAADLIATMTQMRAWLDHQRIEPSVFEFSVLRDGALRFRVQFKNPNQATSFANAFGGEVAAGLTLSRAA
jgi:hypothetical protein